MLLLFFYNIISAIFLIFISLHLLTLVNFIYIEKKSQVLLFFKSSRSFKTN